jgi:hypothetical protein
LQCACQTSRTLIGWKEALPLQLEKAEVLSQLRGLAVACLFNSEIADRVSVRELSFILGQ